ncbi:DUF4330 domain-containing protein [Heliorestis acidaminivorans]|uniref:DUF4330 domain-containing protein n=1 Tax=Heliorestis acidaminivorans TaxID=553427 RepID=A0A6I0F831_9FIRM|nr:DUF4330 domain-containing protein [Heliorestis acidaminivorans]KAB2953648.1 DUF4330 domain-containing protein [Heliorestis acidaminivorans]
MKIVDEKGRLFGLVNPLDLIILIAVIALVAGLATKTKTIVSTTVTEVELTAFFKKVEPELLGNLNTEDPLVGAGGFIDDAKIVAIDVRPHIETSITNTGERITAEDPYYKDVRVTVRGISRSATADLRVGLQEIKAGREYWLKTQFIQLQGITESVQVLDSREVIAEE